MRSLITFISLLILGACDSGQNKNNDTVKANDTAATDYGLDTSIDTDTGTDSGSDTGEDPITIPTEIVLDQYSMLYREPQPQIPLKRWFTTQTECAYPTLSSVDLKQRECRHRRERRPHGCWRDGTGHGAR